VTSQLETMNYPATLTLPEPVTLDLRIPTGPRPRVVQPDAQQLPEDTSTPELHEFSELSFWVQLDASAREIRAYLQPLPHPLPLYGTADFAAAAGDPPEAHAERILQLLGSDPASVLQALCDGSELPAMPPRVPREIPNWRAKAVLATMGKLAAVEAAIASLPEPDHTIVSLAWAGDAKLARRGKTVVGLAVALGLSSDEVDALFIAAEALEV
jgi:hypothetical protein